MPDESKHTDGDQTPIKSPFRTVRFAGAKSELEALSQVWGFLEKTTPRWFEWLGWLFLTGGVSYVAKATGEFSLRLIEVFCYILLYLHFQYFFLTLRFEP